MWEWCGVGLPKTAGEFGVGLDVRNVVFPAVCGFLTFMISRALNCSLELPYWLGLSVSLLVQAGTPVVPGDGFVGRSRIAGSVGLAATANVGATREPGEPLHAGIVGGQSVWWQWDAPSDGELWITTEGVFQFRVPGLSQTTQTLESSTDPGCCWSPVPQWQVGGGIGTYMEWMPDGASRRFYRVVSLP